MSRKILVGDDGSPAARDAHALGALLAEACDGEMVTATVKGAVAFRLRDLAEREGADVIVVGATHHGALVRATVGGVGERLPHVAQCAVAIAPRGFADEGIRRMRMIGVAYDGSAEARRALAVAVEIAERTSGTVQIIGIIQPVPVVSGGYAVSSAYPQMVASAGEGLRAEVDQAIALVPAHLRPYATVRNGDAAEEIVKLAGVLDLLVVGSRGRGALRRTLLGSVSAQLAHTAPCPLLVATP